MPHTDASADAGASGFYAIVPAGGAGTRLWPLSRAGRPKFLLDLTGSGRTLLQATLDRLAPLTGQGRTLVVTGQRHVAAVAEQLDLPASDLLAEPSPRDSMAAIGLAAAVVQHRHGPSVVGSFAADHVIHDQAEFERTVREAVATARAGYVVTIGIEASEPSTAFGYIQAGGALDVPGAPSARLAAGFTEKPDAATARAYLDTGDYRWNAGMFVVRTDVLLAQVRAFDPALADGLERLGAAWDGPERDALLAEVWPTLRKIAIDHAVAEPAAAVGKVAVVPGSFDWDDVGDVAALAQLLTPPDGAGPAVLGDAAQVLTLDAPGAFVAPRTGRQVVVLGVPGAVVVDTPDALLVTTPEHAQQVKAVVDALREAGRTDLL